MMVALVSVETVLLVLLLVLVAGLLRSHAEIMRRLGPAEDGSGSVPQPPVPQPSVTRESAAAPDLAGVTPDGDAIKLAFEGPGTAPTLLAFLTSGCGTCAAFWETLGERRLPAGVRTVIVTHGPDRERPAKLRSLGPAGVPIVMTSEAWADYEIPGAPYFVMVDHAIRGEGVATTWRALASLVSDAIEDQRDAARADGGAGAGTGQRRAERIDETFAAAGIGPDHPSLYPDRRT
ncbi:MAG: TlpA family protein disulfide reductase [Solirubrobacteraceae bacterium]